MALSPIQHRSGMCSEMRYGEQNLVNLHGRHCVATLLVFRLILHRMTGVERDWTS